STPAMQKILVFTTAAPTTLKTTTQSFVTSATETNEEEKLSPQETDEEEDEKDRNQCDEHTSCPPDTTCCFMASFKKWGCCPLPKAVCCSDKEHCCPQGYTCNVFSKTCQKVIMLQLETLPLTPVYLPEYHLQLTPLKHREIQCDDQTSCQDSETCCRTSPTTWGCCPSPHV
ncbi:hypothetical protein XENOCAPTIV_022852, partial [Xenoophorus captivus]